MRKDVIGLKKYNLSRLIGVSLTLIIINVLAIISIDIFMHILLVIFDICFIISIYFGNLRICRFSENKFIIYNDFYDYDKYQIQKKYSINYEDIINIKMGVLKKGLNTNLEEYKKRFLDRDARKSMDQLECLVLSLKDDKKIRMVTTGLRAKKVETIINMLYQKISTK